VTADLRVSCALAAVLRALPEPWSGERVTRAVIATLRAGEEDGGHWSRVVRIALSHRILAVDDDGLWRAGECVDDLSDDGYDQRARKAVQALAAVKAAR
jgi:hypothetical protein